MTEAQIKADSELLVEQIGALIPGFTGRELDYDVGSKVMKLPVSCERRYNTGQEVFFTDAESYSTEIVYAMKVLKFLQTKGFTWSLNSSRDGSFWCVLYPSYFGDCVRSQLCETPQEAICRAALSLAPELL